MSLLSLIFIHIRFIFLLMVLLSEGNREVKRVCFLVTIIFWRVFSLEGITFIWFIAFEFTLIPSLFLLFTRGGQFEKLTAIYLMGVFTYAPSILFIYPLLFYNSISISFTGIEVSLILGLVFISKLPLYGLHFWLPKAHVEAPTFLRIILAALLLKLGYFGFINRMLLMSYEWILMVLVLTVVGCIFAPLITILCSETKVLVAYSSVTHMRFCMLGVLLDSSVLFTASFVVSLAHSYVSILIFFLVGEIFHVVGTRVLSLTRGLRHLRNGVLLCVGLNLMGNAGVPPMLSFFGELSLFCFSFVVLSVTIITLWLYFFFAFYYSIYILLQLIKRQGVVSIPQGVILRGGNVNFIVIGLGLLLVSL